VTNFPHSATQKIGAETPTKIFFYITKLEKEKKKEKPLREMRAWFLPKKPLPRFLVYLQTQL
jgi:hypothetical protein